MSMRTLLSRLWEYGRQGLRPRWHALRRGYSEGVAGGRRMVGGGGGPPPTYMPRSGFEAARRLFVDNVLRRVTNTQSAELRRRTTRQLLFGNSAPFFTLVGVSLASGTGIITKEDELEGICWEIREAVARMQNSMSKYETELFDEGEDVGLHKFTVGPAIAKGSNAVVYAARKNASCLPEEGAIGGLGFAAKESLTAFPFAIKMMFNYDTESNAMSILRAMHREIVPAQLHYSNPELSHWENSLHEQTVALPRHPNIVAMHCVFADSVPRLPGCLSLYPDALPSRINPDGYGRNMSLFLVMKRYDMSLKEFFASRETNKGSGGSSSRDAVLLLAQLLEAVCHINRHGVAHRDLKSDNVLLEYLEGDCCPQLVVTDFGCCLADRNHGLAMPFRSWDMDRGGNAALMAPEVATAEPGLLSYIDYTKSDVWAAGTLGYEMFCGFNPFYGKRGDNPPLRNTTYSEDHLPTLPSDGVPDVIRRLLPSMLARNPKNRPSAEMAATICQLYLWAPSGWLKSLPNEPLPSSGEILQWLLCLSTKVLCSSQLQQQQRREMQVAGGGGESSRVCSSGGRRSAVEYQLIGSLLARARLSTLKSALVWIRRGGH